MIARTLAPRGATPTMDDHLLRRFARNVGLAAPPASFYVPAHVQLHLRLARDAATGAVRVFCKQALAAETFLGYVDGACLYSWDLPTHPDQDLRCVFVVDDDYVIYFGDDPSPSILSFVRDGYCDGDAANVGLVPEPTAVASAACAPTPGAPRIGLKTLRAIAAGEELVYAPGRLYDCDACARLGG